MFFDDLHNVAELRSNELAGHPSDRQLAKRTGASKSTICNWLPRTPGTTGDRPTRRILPRDLTQLLSVIEEIRAEAQARGKLTGSAATLLDAGRWKKSYEAECDRRAKTSRITTERVNARAVLHEQERRARWQALPDRPRPLSMWTAKQLGVHGAIAGTSSRRGDFVLPTYIVREHDRRLRQHLAAAVDSAETTLVLVCGTSCTGKTRTAFEAVRAVVPTWQLIFPKTSDSLLALLAADAAGPGTVLWLNEVQNVLKGPTGEAAAAALLTRLEDDGPTLIIATLWPSYRDEFTTTLSAGSSDPHPHARALLAQARLTDVPKAFTRDQVTALAAYADPSLKAAARSGAVTITQILAAGPDLVDHCENPATPEGVYGRAVIEAAMDAYRLGVTGPLPLAFLQEAAPSYLSDDERAKADDSWFSSALTYARVPVKEVVSALQPVARFTGMGALPDVVTLADYLQQHARTIRGSTCPPAPFWQAAAAHLSAPDSLLILGRAAERRLRRRHAALLYQAAVKAGDPSGWEHLVEMRKEMGDWRGVERIVQAAAESGRPFGWVRLAEMREKAGDLQEAERLYQAAVKAGDSFGWVGLAEMREKAGDLQEAERLYQAAVETGDPFVGVWLAEMRETAGDLQEAERLYRAAVEAGDPFAWMRLVEMWELAGDRQGAERVAQAAAEAGNPSGWGRLAEMRKKAGDLQEAERLYRIAAEAGEPLVWRHLVVMREKAGDRQGAERMAQAAAETRDPSGWVWLAEMREEAGDRQGAERLYRAAADAGSGNELIHFTERRSDRPKEKQGLRYGLEPDGTSSTPW